MQQRVTIYFRHKGSLAFYRRDRSTAERLRTEMTECSFEWFTAPQTDNSRSIEHTFRTSDMNAITIQENR